jgi:hypothetical protein
MVSEVTQGLRSDGNSRPLRLTNHTGAQVTLGVRSHRNSRSLGSKRVQGYMRTLDTNRLSSL